MNLVITKTTDSLLIEFLKDNGVEIVLVDPKIPGGSSGHRKKAVSMAVSSPASPDYVFYIDYDRLVHWLTYYPQELEMLVNNIPNFDLVSVGRTNRAYLTHPKLQQEAEKWTNVELEKLLGVEVDITSGCQILSLRMANIVKKDAYEELMLQASEGDWLGLAYINKMKIGLIRIEGLEFETPDVHQQEIKEIGSYEKWIDSIFGNQKTIDIRWKGAQETVSAAKQRLLGLTNTA